MKLYIGTAGWSYPTGKGRWDGVFYPQSLADRDKLPYYAQYFNSVELNSTFYRPPSPYAARAWAANVPDDFRFTAKLWQKFTHPKMFEEATGSAAQVQESDFELWLGGVEPLASKGKLGALLAQFPPSFKPDEASLDYLANLIGRVRRAALPLAIELRHRGWTDPHEFGPRVRSLFEEENVAWVMIVEPKFRTSIREVPLTSRVGYFRFHGRNYEHWWRHDAAEDRYNYLYGASEQAELATEVRQVSDRVESTFAFYNNHYRAKAVVNALQLKGEFGQPPPVPPPASLLAEYPELAPTQQSGIDFVAE